MKTTYFPKGTCSTRIDITLINGFVENIEIKNGCGDVNREIGVIAMGRKADEAIKALSGLVCGRKNTSCATQIRNALITAIIEENTLSK